MVSLGGVWRRLTLRPAHGASYTERFPLPPGWRPRTMIDVAGREVEPWGYLICDPAGEYDGGEWWLPVGADPDGAAWEILHQWADQHQVRTGMARLVCVARRYGFDGHRAGVAYGHESVAA